MSSAGNPSVGNEGQMDIRTGMTASDLITVYNLMASPCMRHCRQKTKNVCSSVGSRQHGARMDNSDVLE